jgi:peptidoglycan/LPS O-acetylase OafA/YrhL
LDLCRVSCIRLRPERRNHVWSYDFVEAQTHDGPKVLSGFVINFAVDQKEQTISDYLVARFARLYSVVLPALLLTFVCDYIGTHHNARVYFMSYESEPLAKIAWASVFLSQSWQKVGLLSNVPFWSLCYEFWYYLIFGAFIFLKGWQRILGVLLCSVVAGPAIIMLFPIWIMGAAAYRFSRTVTLTPFSAKVIWAASALGSLTAIIFNSQSDTLKSVYLPFAYGPMDFAIGIMFALNLVAASRLEFGISRIHRPVAYLAGMTFALYLFHLPLLDLAAAYTPASLPMLVRVTIEAGFTFGAVFCLSFVTEGQKKKWRLLFRRVFSFLKPTRTAPYHSAR